MFATLESFSIFFFTGLALLLLGIIFDKKLIAVEKKIDRKITQRKASKKKAEIQNARLQKNATRTRTASGNAKPRLAA